MMELDKPTYFNYTARVRIDPALIREAQGGRRLLVVIAGRALLADGDGRDAPGNPSRGTVWEAVKALASLLWERLLSSKSNEPPEEVSVMDVTDLARGLAPGEDVTPADLNAGCAVEAETVEAEEVNP